MSELNNSIVSDALNAKLNQDLPTIVVTGFGLFRNYKVNSSWESVKLLKLENVKLIIKEIPVAYDDVDRYVAQIWSDYKPSLVVHCGVSCMAECITLETRAIDDRSLYTKPDVLGRIPKNGDKQITPNVMSDSNEHKCEKSLPNDSLALVSSKINIPKVCEKVNQRFQDGLIRMPAVMSSNAGRFLCEYIFYSSLKQNSERTAFIHVPEISEKCPLEDIASALEYTIQTLIEEIIQTNNSVTD